MGPWGLDPRLVAPAKVTTDPVHGDIYTTWLEQAVVDSPPFQRLRRVRQLGTTHLVYPGATHSRFSHSLGALRFVQDLLDAVLSQHQGSHPVPDLVATWHEDDPHAGRATVAARLGALLHDIGHVPFGHSMEDDLKVLVEHDANGERFDELWSQVSDAVTKAVHATWPDDATAISKTLETLLLQQGDLHRELRPMIISKGSQRREDMTYPFAADMVGDTICADLLDYLLRDHLNTGLPIALGRRFVSAFFIVPDGRGIFSRRLALSLVRDGHERTDVATELLKALRYRYELSERALVHHAKLSADAMLGKALELWSSALWLQAASPQLADVPDARQMSSAGDIAALQRAHHQHFADEYVRQPNDSPRHAADDAVRRKLEQELLAHGDDGLLELVRDFATRPLDDERFRAEADFGDCVRRAHQQAAELAAAFLERRLFKVAGRVGIEDAPAVELYGRYGDARTRSALERDAEHFAGLDVSDGPQVLLWLPSPKMRVKIAEVLVDDGHHVDRFHAYEEPRGRRGYEIYGGHSRLWAMWLFTHPSMDDDTKDVVSAYLAGRLGVGWERQRHSWGDDYWTWTDRIILARLLDTTPREDEVSRELAVISDLPVTRSNTMTFKDRETAIRSALGTRAKRRVKPRRR